MDGAAAAKPQNLGGSLPVPNVQDLAASDLTPPVLDRYLRDTDAPAVSVVVNGEDATSVPVVDLGRLLDPKLGEKEAAKLRSACENWGFFQVVNHGVPDKVIDAVKEDLKGFFQLPLAEKRAFAQEPGGIEGYGQAFVVSEEQKLDWADMYFLSTQPPEYRDLKFWPSQPSTFRDSLERYSAEVQRVATDLLRIMAKNLGVKDPEKMTMIAGSQSVRINYYPPCPQAHDKVLGLSPHSDAVGLTLLLQVSPVAGLQIRKNGSWIPVAPLPGALVANVGDVIEVLTNGKYKSIEHRAVVNAREERVSIAAFHAAKFGETYEPLEEMVGEGAARYRTISVEDYVKLLLSSKLDGKNIMDAMKINP
uniref:Fe2OG dioxygenase domain-containing protein n=1 Tax=Arundo donax TaxID=35708 RepID=A0A0A9BFT8_ARUDO